MATRGRPPKQVLAARILIHRKTELPTRSRREEARLRSKGLQATGGAEAVPGLQQVHGEGGPRAPVVNTLSYDAPRGLCADRPPSNTAVTKYMAHGRPLRATGCTRPRARGRDAVTAAAADKTTTEKSLRPHDGEGAGTVNEVTTGNGARNEHEPRQRRPRPAGRAAHTPASASGCRLHTPSSALDCQVHEAKRTPTRSLHPIPKADNTLPAAGTGRRGTDARLTGERAPAATQPRLTFHTQHVFKGLMGKSPPAETLPEESRKGLQVRGLVGKTVAPSPGGTGQLGLATQRARQASEGTLGSPGAGAAGRADRGDARRDRGPAAHGCQEEVGATGHSWDRPPGLWRNTGDSSGHKHSTESAAPSPRPMALSTGQAHGSWDPRGRSSAPASDSKGPSQTTVSFHTEANLLCASINPRLHSLETQQRPPTERPPRGQHGASTGPLHQGWRRGRAHGGWERSSELPRGDDPVAPSRQVHSEMLTTYEQQEHKLLGNPPNNRQRPGQKRSGPRIPRQTLQTESAAAPRGRGGRQAPQEAPRVKAAGPGGPARLRQWLSRRTRDRRTAGPPPTWLEEAGQGLAGPEGQGSTAALSVEGGADRVSDLLKHALCKIAIKDKGGAAVRSGRGACAGATRGGCLAVRPPAPAEAEAPQAEKGGAGPMGAGRSGAAAHRPALGDPVRREARPPAGHAAQHRKHSQREFVFPDVDSPSRDTCEPQPSSTRQSPTGPLGRCPTPAPRSEALFPQKCRLLPVTSTQGPGRR
nr:collagen alpha-2(I) chain-like [Vulpes vulpes]